MNQQLKEQKRETNGPPKPAGGDAEEGWVLSHVSKVELLGPLRIAYDHWAAQTFGDSTHDAMFRGMFTVHVNPCDDEAEPPSSLCSSIDCWSDF